TEQVYQSGGAYTTDGEAEFRSWHGVCGDADVHNPPVFPSRKKQTKADGRQLGNA
ncbi:hypothetical protein V1517DRAFT_266516, partial [Lipomyces orientalis]